MSHLRSFQQKLAKIQRHWKEQQYDTALSIVDETLQSWPGNAHLHVLRASLIQLQEKPSVSLAEARKSLQRAVDLDGDSPAALVELGHFLDAVEDEPEQASKAFAEAVSRGRRLLIEGLLGHARALLELQRREEAIQCVMEALYLANADHARKAPQAAPDVLLRDASGDLLAVQIKGPFAARVEDLLEELFRNKSA